MILSGLLILSLSPIPVLVLIVWVLRLEILPGSASFLINLNLNYGP